MQRFEFPMTEYVYKLFKISLYLLWINGRRIKIRLFICLYSIRWCLPAERPFPRKSFKGWAFHILKMNTLVRLIYLLSSTSLLSVFFKYIMLSLNSIISTDLCQTTQLNLFCENFLYNCQLY